MADGELLEQLRTALPIAPVAYDIGERATGLVVSDAVHGFCTVGSGNLAPKAPDEDISRMIEVIAGMARRFRQRRRPVLAFLDTHEPGKPEPPYPPHCERGTGEENLVPDLAWLADDPDVTLIRKDCINGFIGAIEPTFVKGAHGTTHNKCVDWVSANRLRTIVVVGICTDICVMDFVLTVLSARNHGCMPTLKDVVVLAPGCATYDLPATAAAAAGLPPTAAHPKEPTHHLGLYFMAARGAIIADDIKDDEQTTPR